MADSGEATTKPERRGTEDQAAKGRVAATVRHICEGKPLVLLQGNCRSICNKFLEFWNVIDTYKPDVVIGTESWLSEEIKNAENFRDDYITFRKDRRFGGDGVFICVKNYMDCWELWTYGDFEKLAVDVKGK